MSEIRLESGFNEDKSKKISIILADDHPLLRQALKYVLEKHDDFEIVAEASDGEEAVRLAVELVPDVVIMDISMPKLNGLEATQKIKTRCPRVAVLVLTVHDDSEHILGILEAGAAGYLTKSVFGDEVIHAIRSVVAGDTVLSPNVSCQLMKQALRYVTKPIRLRDGEKLSKRELQILSMAARGLSNREIAERLEITQRTVKSYLTGLFSKLNVRSRTEAVLFALRTGMIKLDDLE